MVRGGSPAVVCRCQTSMPVRPRSYERVLAQVTRCFDTPPSSDTGTLKIPMDGAFLDPSRSRPRSVSAATAQDPQRCRPLPNSIGRPHVPCETMKANAPRSAIPFDVECRHLLNRSDRMRIGLTSSRGEQCSYLAGRIVRAVDYRNTIYTTDNIASPHNQDNHTSISSHFFHT